MKAWMTKLRRVASFVRRFFVEVSNKGFKIAATNTLFYTASKLRQFVDADDKVCSQSKVNVQEFVFEEMRKDPVAESQVRTICFYLPQFHPIPENDLWWGEGFTEWTNVVRARPLFTGHQQPRLPGSLGFYDLRLVETMKSQASLAKRYGVSGFCFHHYWFMGRRLLERPVEQFLVTPDIDIGFCLCWANETWTRRWDGNDRHVLIAQNYSRQDEIVFIEHLKSFFRDRRYMRVNGRPLVVVYNPGDLSDSHRMLSTWRQACESEFGGLYVVKALTHWSSSRLQGFDSCVQFPPHCHHGHMIQKDGTDQSFNGVLCSYPEMAKGYCRELKAGKSIIPCVSPGWDNTPRLRERAVIYADATPNAFAEWFRTAKSHALAKTDPSKGLVFVNAWNEWAEGAFLEPDAVHGYAYLNRIGSVLDGHG
ncbi:MAG: hypothetical protein EOM25_04270 [Deltaproteobacteria bacterium]|nr:hypothetical protein [Deltaproteobacteria bacterium]